jgi:hypothetical protein
LLREALTALPFTQKAPALQPGLFCFSELLRTLAETNHNEQIRPLSGWPLWRSGEGRNFIEFEI